MTTSTLDQLCGKTDEHIAVEGDHAGILHQQVVEPFEALKTKAASAGFDLRIASGYRSFDRQLAIWNAKACGERPVLDDTSCAVDVNSLTEIETVQAILRWSALPGTSRHHWGSDFDVYDAASVDADYQVQLIPEETKDGGVFAGMHRWLDEVLPKTDFFRPYEKDLGGTGPEPWHLSYEPVASKYAQQSSPATILSAFEGVEIELRDAISENIEMIFQRYIALPQS